MKLPAIALGSARHRILLVVLAWLSLTAQSYDAGDLDQAFRRDVLIISASEHACYRFDVWLATSNAQQRRGLMFVRELPPFTGMLFVYPEAGRKSMWMKNTFIPLDMLFIRADGTVASIIQNTEPQSLVSRRSTEPVNFVLELDGGVTEALGIAAGGMVYWDPAPVSP